MVEEVVEMMKYLVDPTLPFEIKESATMVMPMQSLTYPTLPLGIYESTKVVMLMKSSTNPTLILGSDVSIDHVFRISSSIPFKLGEFPLISSMIPPNSRMVPLIGVILLSLMFLLLHPSK